MPDCEELVGVFTGNGEVGLVQKKQSKRVQIVCSRTTRARGEKSGVRMGVYKKLHLAHISKILVKSGEYSYQNQLLN